MKLLLDRIDAGWTRMEVALCMAVTALLVSALICWVVLKGLSSRTTDSFVAGLALRSLGGALLFGVMARWVTRPWSGRPRTRGAAVAAAVISGVISGWCGRDVGVLYFGNLLGWLQDGSLLTLTGGLRGLGTRLTLWLALLGASLATASGRHIGIDVAPRALGHRARRALNQAGALAAASVCMIAAWGFFDFIAVDAFGARSGAPAGDKIATVAHGVSKHLFLARQQLALDARTLGRVVAGDPWDRSLSAAQWNRMLDEGNWSSRLGADAVRPLRETDPSAARAPLVAAPGEPSRGLLVKSLNLVIPWGLLIVALRFLLWASRGAPQPEPHELVAPSSDGGSA
jgi:hypothetical protein